MNLATSSPEDQVQEALARPRTWEAVAEAFNVIAYDLHGTEELIRRNLAMKNQVTRFLMSADQCLGKEPAFKRSRFGLAAPKKPMTVAEAYAFVARLSMAWRAQRQRAAA